MLRFRLELARLELDSVTPRTGTATTDIQDMAIIREAIIAITGVIHITARIMDGRTIAVTDITSITSVTTATKTQS